MTPEGREQDAEEVVDALSRKHGLRVDGVQPRYSIDLDEALCRGLESGSLDDPLHTADAELPATSPRRLEIGDFIAASRDHALEDGLWYRLHAPAGYRCRPKGFA